MVEFFFYSPPPPPQTEKNKYPKKGDHFFRFSKFLLQSLVTFCDKKTFFLSPKSD